MFDTGKESIRRGTCRVDSKGYPHLIFRQGGGQVRYYRWTGSEWQDPVVVTHESKSQDGDLFVESPLKIRMLLTQTIAGRGEVGWWNTSDGGLTWNKEPSLISADNAGFLVGSLVRNAHPDAQVVTSEMNARQDHLYRKLFLLGDKGAVQRR